MVIHRLRVYTFKWYIVKLWFKKKVVNMLNNTQNNKGGNVPSNVTSKKVNTTKKVTKNPVVKPKKQTTPKPTNVISINKFLQSGNVITLYKIVNTSLLQGGTIINNSGVKTSLKGYTHYNITNVTILNNRNIVNVSVYLKNGNIPIITCTRKLKSGGTNTVLYNHLPNKHVIQLQNNQINKFNYNKPLTK
jgi:hypothetical protein